MLLKIAWLIAVRAHVETNRNKRTGAKTPALLPLAEEDAVT